jgi:hypothetical protein
MQKGRVVFWALADDAKTADTAIAAVRPAITYRITVLLSFGPCATNTGPARFVSRTAYQFIPDRVDRVTEPIWGVAVIPTPGTRCRSQGIVTASTNQ